MTTGECAMAVDDGPAWLGMDPVRTCMDKKYFMATVDYQRAFAKQSLLPHEMASDIKSPETLSRQCAARLRNKVAAIQFISQNT